MPGVSLVERFLDHPRSVGENYFQHARVAVSFGARMIGGGLRCVLHALLPPVFQNAASDCVRSLHAELERRRRGSGSGDDYVI